MPSESDSGGQKKWAMARPLQIITQSRHVIQKHKSKWDEQQIRRAEILFEKSADPKSAAPLFSQKENQRLTFVRKSLIIYVDQIGLEPMTSRL